MNPSSNRRELGNPASTEDAAPPPLQHKRQAVVALVVGAGAILACALVGYLAYDVNREMIFRRVAKENLTIARTLANYILERPAAGDEAAMTRSLEQIRAFWKRFDPPTSEAFLCVVTPEGKLVVCTAHCNMEGGLVDDVPLAKSSVPGAATIGDLLSRKQDFFGEDVTLMGERQLVGFAYSETLDRGFMVHFPTAQIESDVAAASLPWTVGIVVVAGLLIPLSLGLLHRSYSSARRAALRSEAALRASEAEHSDLYENSPEMHVSVDARTARIRRCNQTMATALGYAKEEIVGRRVFDLYHPDSVEAAKRAFDAFVTTGEVHDAELQLERKDGSTLDVSLSVSAIRDENGKVLLSRCSWRDVTDRKRTETALRRLVEVSSRRFGEPFLESAALELATTLGADYTFIGELQQGERESIRSIASVADGKLAANFEYDLAGTPCEDVVRKSVCTYASGVAQRFPEDTLLQQMGVQSYVGVQLVDSQHAVLGIVTALFRKPIDHAEFTESILQIYSSRIGSELERLRSDKALVESEQRYRAIAEDTPVLICRFLPGAEITYVNEAYCKCFQKTADELIGHTFLTTIAEADRETVMANIAALTIDSPTQSHEHQVVAPGGELRWQRWTNRALFDDAGTVVAYQSIGEDVTERKRAEEARRESEVRLRSILDSMITFVGLFTLDGVLVEANEAPLRAANLKREDVIGKPFWETYWWSYSPKVQQELQAALRRAACGETIRYDVPVRVADGRFITMDVTFGPLYDESGEVVQLVGSGTDITERKQAEEAIQEKEKQLDNLLSNVGVIVLEGDPFRMYYVGGQVERILGYRKELWFEDLDGPVGFWAKHLHPDDVDSIEICRSAIELGKDHILEYRMIAADGREVWFYDTVTVETKHGKAVKTRSVMVDVTERKHVEEALRRSEERLDLAIRGTSDGLWDAELDTGKEYWSPRFKELLGYDEDEIEATHDRFLSFLHPEDKTEVLEAIRLHLEENQPYDREFRMQTKCGEYRWFQSRGEALRDEAGRPYRMAGSIRDITERKRAEEERRELEAQLRQSQKMEAIGQLAGGVAHDFNNLLTAILGNVELGMISVRRESRTDHSIVESLEEIEKAAHRASVLTRQLLAFSRRSVMQPEVLNLNHILEGLDEMLRRLITEDIALETVTDPQLKSVRADAGQLEQVIVNLLVNATHAMPKGGRLTLETRNVTLDDSYTTSHAEARHGPYVMLVVSDTGHGMDAATQERIFEPFFTTKPVGKGTGLGLATVHGIVKQSGGHIAVYSEPGRGTTFKIYLPAIEATPADQAPISDSDAPRRGRETVLLCEDDRSVCELIAEFLRTAGYTVITAANGREGLEAAQAHGGSIDLLITDVIMPGMNGRALSEQLRVTLPGLPTLFISGYTSDVIAHHGVLDEGVEFLEKPFTQKSLLAKVGAVLNRARSEV